MALAKKAMSVHEAEKIAQKIALEQNVELVDVELVKEPTGYFLRFYIEKPEGISLNELETYHRAIQPLVENVAYDYMEVSSPGADRPLKNERDFERAKGMDVELKTYRPVNGAKVFQGELIGLKDGIIEISSGEEILSFPKKDVAIVRPLIEFTEEDLKDDAPAGQ
jgi:ribosome maturation factor RimP